VPEGDTIFRAAQTLDRALAGKAITRFDAPRLARTGERAVLPGTVITGVEAKGKHCLIHLDESPRRSLHSHMGMTGSWHLYRPGERWRRSRGAARVTIEVEDWIAVCFSPQRLALVADVATVTGHLGPDLCRVDADIDECLRRLDTVVPTELTIGEALLDQRVACGVGNVYRCEVLFTHHLDPFTPVAEVPAELRRRLLTDASRYLRQNLSGVDRRIDGHLPSVHGRGGRPCRRCGTLIRTLAHGESARITYWCPACQPRR
jgi:endonuclease VIII